MANNAYIGTISRSLSIEKCIATCCAAYIVALSAALTIPLPFTPVPITLQVHLALCFSALLGARHALLMMILFFFIGICGFPVCAGGKMLTLASPSLGYLIGYTVAGSMLGWLAEEGRLSSRMRSFLLLALANCIVYVFGLAYLQFFVGGLNQAFMLGVVPFLPGALLKTVIIARYCRFS